jgi:hypothetical protein
MQIKKNKYKPRLIHVTEPILTSHSEYTARKTKSPTRGITREKVQKSDSCHSSRGIFQSKVGQGKQNVNLICNYQRESHI